MESTRTPAARSGRTQDSSRLGVGGYLAAVLDAGSYRSWDAAIHSGPSADRRYGRDLRRAREATGVDESVLTGTGTIDGRPIAVVASEFGFLGGSIGVASAQRIEAAIRRATRERLPVLAAPASGGTRMQEGTAAFLQMVRITAAVVDHKAAGLAYLVHCRHPTTGGVFASWASLGQVTLGEPGALLGFLGPKVYEALNSAPFPAGIQLSENLARHGIIDAVVPTDRTAAYLARVLRIISTPPDEPPVVDMPEARPGSAWESVLRTRSASRAGACVVLQRAAEDVVPLLGADLDDPRSGIIVGLARLCGTSCVVIAQEREAQRGDAPLGPADLRAARHGIEIAGELGLPVVTFIDTPGAALSADAEEGGLSGEIALCLSDLLRLPTPVVCVLLGAGAGGGALSLFTADRVVASEHAWLAPLPPEGASALLHGGDVSFAPQVADQQGISAWALARAGVVDQLVAEIEDVDGYARALGAAVAEQLRRASASPVDARRAARSERLRPRM